MATDQLPPPSSYELWVRRLVTALAVGMSLFHLYIAYFGPPNAFVLRSSHLGMALVLVYMSMPGFLRRRKAAPRLLDWLFICASFAAAAYPIIEQHYFSTRMAYVGPVSQTDLFFGVLMMLVILEATRRAIGLILPITALIFLGYQLLFTSINPVRLVEYQYMTTDAIFGIPIQVSATYVVLFVVFGALCERMGVGKLFMDFSLALTGHTAGGPAKVAVVSSGIFGSISGSATANVMTTGAFTIPLMKKIGYRPAFAGAVEAVASTGGQIMPPIMGAAAFVMAEFLGVSYLTVATFAILPALLYYFAVFIAVHFEARKRGMKGLPKADLPRLGAVMKERGHLFGPLVIIIATLLWGYSAPYAALLGILSIVPLALLRKTTRQEVTLQKIIDGLASGALNSLIVAMACATAGIVIGVIAQTGLGLTFTGIVRGLAADSLILALLLTMVAGIILGMGMPTTPAYIVQVALLVPALVKLGVQVEAAHFFVFYFAILSAITPPVAIAVFAACGIARSPIWETSMISVRLALAGYIIPFMFIFDPSLLMIGHWTTVLITALTAFAGVTLLAIGLQAYLFAPVKWLPRLLFIAAAITLIKPGLVTDAIGVGLAVFAYLLDFYDRRRAAPLASSQTGERAPVTSGGEG